MDSPERITGTEQRAPMLSGFGALAVFLWMMSLLCVVVGHEVLEFVVLFIAHLGCSFVVIVILEDAGEEVFGGFALGVSHGVDGSVGAFGEQLVLQTVAAAIAPDDAAHLPEADVVEELTARDAYLAHDQLVDVVGGG